MLTWVACHYLSRRPVLLWPLASEQDGDACFVRTLLLSAAVVSAHYLVTCILLLFGGILKARHALFVPWVVTHAVVIIFMGGLSAAEVRINHHTSFFNANIAIIEMIVLIDWRFIWRNRGVVGGLVLGRGHCRLRADLAVRSLQLGRGQATG